MNFSIYFLIFLNFLAVSSSNSTSNPLEAAKKLLKSIENSIKLKDRNGLISIFSTTSRIDECCPIMFNQTKIVDKLLEKSFNEKDHKIYHSRFLEKEIILFFMVNSTNRNSGEIVSRGVLAYKKNTNLGYGISYSYRFGCERKWNSLFECLN
ncbi:unnamed protein product [Caenorhabditis angaria]|uniref:Uncharacterized protein n=1 Tax=Caenorhabditis angaria TaxID=860376 RepID=A0A9P1IE82_9PELO|nr:unnamed protein product [Caenorhabditis angaria]